MHRTIILFAVLILIVGGAFILGRQQDPTTSSLDDYEGNFAVEDIESVARVVITKGREDEYVLRKTSKGWTVNDRYRARMSSVEPLLEALAEVEIKYIPAKAALENITWEIAAHGIRVRAFDRNDNMLKSYFVGGSTFDERGTHMLMEGSNQPFVTHLPTMDGSLRPRFTLTLDDWRDRHFMDISAEEISAVKVAYPRQKSQSFVLTRKGNTYVVEPMYPDLRNYPSKYRQGSAEQFIRALTNAACEGYESRYPKKDSIRAMVPFSTIRVLMKDTTENKLLNIYPKGPVVSSEFTGPIHRLFVDLKPGDLMGAQYGVIKGILRGYDFFFEGADQELIF